MYFSVFLVKYNVIVFGIYYVLKKSIMKLRCIPDLVTSYLVTNLDLVTIFLVHKNISFSDNLAFLPLRFSDTKFGLFLVKNVFFNLNLSFNCY